MSEVLKKVENILMIGDKEHNCITIIDTDNMNKIVLNKFVLEEIMGVAFNFLKDSLTIDLQKNKKDATWYAELLKNDTASAERLFLSEDLIQRMQDRIESYEKSLEILELVKSNGLFKLR